MILPCEDNCLRKIALDRHACRVARYENLPLDIERGLVAIIEREIELTRRLDLLKRELEMRHDYTTYSAFKAITSCCDSSINNYNLSQFLRQNGYYPSEREVLAIIRRMDTSCIARVSYNDFVDFMRGFGSGDISSSFSHSPSPARSLSAGKNGSRRFDDSPVQKTRSQSAIRTRTAKKACCDDCADKGTSCASTKKPVYCKPVCVPSYCDCSCRVFKYCRPESCLCRCRRVYCGLSSCSCICRPSLLCDPICPPVCAPVCAPVLSCGKEYELTKALYDIIREERDLESAKISLAKRSDFNLYDAFKIFDPCNRGYVTLSDLRDGLSAIGVFPTTSDMELYIKRYSKYHDGKVRFSDFCDSFTPTTDSYYASSLGARRSNYWNKCCGARDDCFDAGTRVEFRSAWNTHFKVEAGCEGIRQRLRSFPCFDLYSAFLSCDLYSDGFISRDELRRFIDCRGFCVTDTDAKHLVDKMDQNKDGRVTYSEVSKPI